jgi:hypothetical protein
MTRDRDQWADTLSPDNGGGWLTGFLAEENEFDRRALWRLGSWGVGAVAAVVVALLANQSSVGLRRDQTASADLIRQSQQIQWIAKESQNETRRLGSAVETLNNDRDRLYARVTVLEQGLDSVTGSIGSQSAAAPPAPAPPPPPVVTAPTPVASARPQPAAELPTVARREVPETAAAATAPAQAKANLPGSVPGPLQGPLQGPLPTPAAAAATSFASAEKSNAATAQPNPSAVSPPAPAPPAAIPVVTLREPTNDASAAAITAMPPKAAGNNTAGNGLAFNPAPTNTMAALAPGAAPATSGPNPATQAAPPALAAKPAAPARKTTTTAMPLMPSKSIMAPPDPSATRLTELEPGPNAGAMAPVPYVAASTPTEPGGVEIQAPPAIAVQRTEFGIDLGGANSIDGLRALWRGLLRNHTSKVLADLRPIIVVKERGNGLGMQLRLVAGPLGDAAAAAKLCAALTESDRSCETTVFDGQRLAIKNEITAAPAAVSNERPAPPVQVRPQRRRVAPPKGAKTEEQEPAPPPPPPPTQQSALTSLLGIHARPPE